MSEKIDAFKAALHALCVEHDLSLRLHWVDCDDCQVEAVEPRDDLAAGCHLEIKVPPTAEEVAAEEARLAEERAARRAREAVYEAEYIARYGHLVGTGNLAELSAAIEAERIEQRKKNMRVTRIPGDHNDIGNELCRVYLNEILVTDWIVADDFRRVVETPDGAKFGSVRIEMEGAAPVMEPEPTPVPTNSLSGMFVPVPKPAAPAIEVVEASAVEPEPVPAPPYAAPKVAVKPAAPKKKRGR